MTTTITAMWTVFRLRHHDMPALVAGMDRPPRRRRGTRPSVTPIVLTLRISAGFSAPMRENALVVAALHRCGVPAQLVVGADPVPESHGGYRIYTWIEIAGVPLDTESPPGNYLVELIRFPKSGETHS
ncbi:hypothetical protein GCM10023195_64870 [Actinoallomurus liliacearum]|uniref:Microcin J25-processing protein McjB C-terminal domain-containing protein n=1 Tax=Actinoallomurus liliacearum TaxID=1080073 RepID=A0ABP8TRM4_9ACTN